MAAVDYFLKLGSEIKGESKDSKHAGECELESFSWGVSNQGASGHGTGAGAGKASVQDFHFTMKMSAASPKFLLYSTNGKHIAKATLTCRKAGGKQEEFLKIDFTDCFVSSYQTGGSGGSDIVPMEQISINFTKFEFDYLAQDEKGITKSAGKTWWDQKTNTGG